MPIRNSQVVSRPNLPTLHTDTVPRAIPKPRVPLVSLCPVRLEDHHAITSSLRVDFRAASPVRGEGLVRPASAFGEIEGGHNNRVERV